MTQTASGAFSASRVSWQAGRPVDDRRVDACLSSMPICAVRACRVLSDRDEDAAMHPAYRRGGPYGADGGLRRDALRTRPGTRSGLRRRWPASSKRRRGEAGRSLFAGVRQPRKHCLPGGGEQSVHGYAAPERARLRTAIVWEAVARIAGKALAPRRSRCWEPRIVIRAVTVFPMTSRR